MSNQYTIAPYTNEEINNIIALHRNGMPYSMISRKLKRSPEKIKNILIEQGIYVDDKTKGKFKKNQIPHNKKTYTEKEIRNIVELYENGNSIGKMSNILKVDKKRIKEILIKTDTFIEGRDNIKKEFSDEIIDSIIENYKNGLSCQKISEIYNVSKGPINRILKEKKLLKAGYSNGIKIELTEEHKENIKKLYLEEYKNCNEIGKILELSVSFISSHIQKTGYKRTRSNGTSVGLIKRYRGSSYSYVKYLNELEEFYKYKRDVNRITSQQSIESLSNYNKRGKSGIYGVYHLDHKFSIMEGFINKIDSYIIGNINNLEFIPWEDNLKKRAKCSIKKENLIYN